MTKPNARTGLAVLLTGFLALTACSGGGATSASPGGTTDPTDGGPTTSATEPGEPGKDITLTLSTFGNFGYTDELIAKFEEAHPGIKVEHNIAADGPSARTNLMTGLAGGSGLADVEAIETSWTADLVPYADKFYPVPTSTDGGAWVDFQNQQVEAGDGQLFGYGVSIGPAAVCYRADLFEQAGFPTDPAEVATLLEGSWEHYLEVGKQYQAAGGGAWFDTLMGTYLRQIQQMHYPYENAAGEIVATTNPDVENAFRITADTVDLSAKLKLFSPDWYTGMATGAFATIMCPSWMLGLIQNAAPDVTDWRVANVYPGGPGNAGGSYLVVPKQTEHPEEAQMLADWLTSPEQQIYAFEQAGPFPSRVDAYKMPELANATNEYFGNAPVGEIFISQAEALKHVAYTGPNFFAIQGAAGGAMGRVEDGLQDVDAAWNEFVSEVEALQ